jgi:hypothetical protein
LLRNLSKRTESKRDFTRQVLQVRQSHFFVGAHASYLTRMLFPSVLLLQLCRFLCFFIQYFLMSALLPHYRKSCKQRVPRYCLSKQASVFGGRLCGANSFATEIVRINLTDRQTLQ